MSRAALVAVAICLAAAALEGVLAGRGTKRRLEQLRQPPHSPRFATWVVVGLCYYFTCFVVLSRLISSSRSPLGWVSFVLVIALLIGNALWNLVFFRLKNIDASVAILLAYVAVALVLTSFLMLVDEVSGWVFVPYVMYLAYATWWLLSLRKLNRGMRGEVA